MPPPVQSATMPIEIITTISEDFMIFSSLEFIFLFLPVFLLVYKFLPDRFRNLWIIFGSLVFYTCGSYKNPEYILYFLTTILCNYALGQLIFDNPKWRTPLTVLGVLCSLLPLAFFKLAAGRVAFPLGISFFTFQNLSYLLDVYHHRCQPERSFLHYAAYISMFPQLLSGPIVSFRSIRTQLHLRLLSRQKVLQGLELFVLGLGSKVLIANRLGGLWRGVSMIGYESISTPLAWMGILAYSLQLYFDFSGYSMMAAGLGKMLGFEFPRNFMHPYASVSFSDFFRRWHMTLGSWFRDYVYIPLGGNRRGTFLTIRNLLTVWLLTSLWHGIRWNYLCWGMSVGILIVLERFCYGKLLKKHRTLGHLYILSLTPMMWLVFALPDLSDFTVYLTRLFPVLPQPERMVFAGDWIAYLSDYAPFLLAGILLCFPAAESLWKKFPYIRIKALMLIVIFCLCIYSIYMGMNDPFLYFQF